MPNNHQPETTYQRGTEPITATMLHELNKLFAKKLEKTLLNNNAILQAMAKHAGVDIDKFMK